MWPFKGKKKKVDNSLTTSRSFFWGGSSAGTFVNEHSAMQTAAVYACVRVITEAVAGLPIHVYRNDGNDVRSVPDHHLYSLLHFAPNAEMTSLLANQSILIYNLRHKDAPRDLLTEEEVELLISPLELASYKNAITEAMFKGTARNILSESDGDNAAKNETAG